MSVHTGSCRCGRVRLGVTGAPMLTMACHCTGCQRMTASAFSLSSLYHQDAVTIEGETVMGGMQGELQHHCCAFCLSWVFTRADFLGPLVNIRSTMIEGGAAAKPFIECWLEEKLPWVSIGATHAYRQFPPEAQFPALMAEFARQSVRG
ncbi:GFA family protein [uncultured Paracoccus sp.]|uniref:GFA family protein n=1 Tax=uncultured Paracoccus sp. TaxID=189685 RepID=UPI00260718F5|nr:GFA family protein [uncultured Paracoccus sp.]